MCNNVWAEPSPPRTIAPAPVVHVETQPPKVGVRLLTFCRITLFPLPVFTLWSCDRLCWSHGSRLRCLYQRNQQREHHTATHLCHLPCLLLGHLLSRRSRTSTSHAVLLTHRRCRSVLSRPLLLTSRERWIRKRKTRRRNTEFSAVFSSARTKSQSSAFDLLTLTRLYFHDTRSVIWIN